jgi:hypothetical protein
MKLHLFDALIREKYVVSVYDCGTNHNTQLEEMRTWCSATFGVRTYKPSLSNFYFINESDRLMFIMRYTE